MDNVERALERIAMALGLMRSMIESGESFTETSRKAYDQAIQDIAWIKSPQ